MPRSPALPHRPDEDTPRSPGAERGVLVGEQSTPNGAARAMRGRTHQQRVRARFRKDKVGLVALAGCIVIATLALTAPLLASWGLIDPSTLHPELVTDIGSLPTGPLGGISAEHWFGVEPGTGRDLLARILVGLSTSMLIATLTTLLSVVVGTVLGMVAGLAGGWVDGTIGRVIDLVLSFPGLLMLLTLAPIMTDAVHDVLRLPEGPPSQIAFIIIVLAFFSWPFHARVIRGQVLSLREQEFIEAAQSLGASRAWLYRRELLPHLWAPILVYATLMLPIFIAAEAALGFLGVGIQAPAASLGSILNDSLRYNAVDPAYFIFPNLVLVLIVLAMNLLGDSLQDAIEPPTRGGS